MNNHDRLNDWAQHLLMAEKNLKALEYKLLHKQYEGVDNNVSAIMRSLSGVLLWVEDEQQAHA